MREANGRRMPSDGKSSHFHRQGELKTWWKKKYSYNALKSKEVIRICKSKDGQHNGKKWQKDKQWSTKHAHKTKDRVTQTPLKTGVNLGARERCGTRVYHGWKLTTESIYYGGQNTIGHRSFLHSSISWPITGFVTILTRVPHLSRAPKFTPVFSGVCAWSIFIHGILPPPLLKIEPPHF
jgi:hypothetical protein